MVLPKSTMWMPCYMNMVLFDALVRIRVPLCYHIMPSLYCNTIYYSIFSWTLFWPTGQLRSVQEELDSLEEEKASELWEAQEELHAAQEEVQELQQAAEEAAAERENDIALLQEELCRLRAELERLRGTTQEYELELTTLRAEISMKNQCREEEEKAGGEGLIPTTLQAPNRGIPEKKTSLYQLEV